MENLNSTQNIEGDCILDQNDNLNSNLFPKDPNNTEGRNIENENNENEIFYSAALIGHDFEIIENIELSEQFELLDKDEILKELTIDQAKEKLDYLIKSFEEKQPYFVHYPKIKKTYDYLIRMPYYGIFDTNNGKRRPPLLRYVQGLFSKKQYMTFLAENVVQMMDYAKYKYNDIQVTKKLVEDIISLLEVSKIENIDNLPIDKKICNICFKNFKNADTTFILPCSHFYHENCIRNMLNKNGYCPTCKE